MVSSNKMMEAARKMWPGRHGNYEEMCALAAAGQLGGPQMHQLSEHLADCEPCRGFLESLAEVSAQIGPLLAENAPSADIAVPEGIRARFLARLAAEEQTAAHVVKLPRQLANPAPPIARVPRFAMAWRTAAALAACTAIGVTGFSLGARRVKPLPQQAIAMPAPTSPRPTAPLTEPALPVTANSDDVLRIQRLEEEKAALNTELNQLQQQLAAEKTAQASLAEQLATAQSKYTLAVAQSQTSAQNTQSEIQAARTLSAGLQSQLDQLRQQLANSDRRLTAQSHTSEELSARLDASTLELQREREDRSAKSQVGEVLGARNLHIVDVYDADGNGKQKSVGRVFYIEGKSLVFYAYDLDRPGRFKTDVAFHVWGSKVGVKQVVQTLGILGKDDGAQGRWKLTFDDPQVLARINAVYVTAEAANNRQTSPTGKKILFAYLGTPPNHPGEGLD